MERIRPPSTARLIPLIAPPAWVQRNVIIAAVSEERFTQQKNDEGYPRQAIEDCLRQRGISSKELDLILIGG